MKAETIIECNACHVCDGELYEGWRVGCDDLVFRAGAEESLKAKEMEMKQKAIKAFKENCQRPKDTEPCVCELCVRWVGGHCELLDGFIEKLNS